MHTFFDKYNEAGFSQNGEQGIIAEAVGRINPSLKVAVEFGAPSKEYYSNTFFLDEQGWKVWYYDLNPSEEGIEKKEITPENVNELPECSVLSIDIDEKDYDVWEAYKGKPDIVIIEINSGFGGEQDGVTSETNLGTAYRPMVKLGIEKGYFLLVHTGNLIFVRNDHRELFPEVIGDGLSNWQDYYQERWRFK